MLVFSISLFSCSDNKSSSEKAPTDKNIETAALTPTNNESGSNKGLTGTWKLQLEVFDDNGNRIPDEEEMKKGFGNNYIFQFNADGSCRIQQIFTGRYEKKVEDGRDMLYVYRKKVEGEEDEDPPPDIYQITSLKKDELVLQMLIIGDPSSFWFFKRIN
jgi:hypothetical protein